MTADDRIADLEYRLDRYHEWLAKAINDRDRLALDAAWGVHYGLYAAFSLIGLYLLTDKLLGLDSWLVGAGFAIATMFIQGAVFAWSNGQRMKEVDRLAKLPTWESKFELR